MSTRRNNRKENFSAGADTGIQILILPIEVTIRNGSNWGELDPNEPSCASIKGHDLNILGTYNILCKVWTFLRTIRR